MMMVRSCTAGEPYDLVISEIRLPDESAYQLMNRLVPLLQPVPLIMMKEYGYDVDHVFTRARENGLHPKAILFKPFRLDQLLQVATTILDHCQRVKRGDA
jgi:DNA-binding NtrC family response regulator